VEWSQSVLGVIAIAVPVILAITFHEAAHGFVAWRLGDDTAYRQGRVTFNPLRHVDAFGTVLLPALLVLLRAPILFGWARPVPVDFGRLNNPRRDMILVAAAGPGTNVALALVSGVLVHLAVVLPPATANWVVSALAWSILINCALAVFNMLPVPPLDGGRVAVGLLPERLAVPLARLEPYGLFIIIGVLFVVPILAAEAGIEVRILSAILVPAIGFLFDVIGLLSGVAVQNLVGEVTGIRLWNA